MHSAYGIRVSFKSAQKQTIPCVALPMPNRRRMLSHCERPPRRCCVGFGHGAACLGGFLDAHRRVGGVLLVPAVQGLHGSDSPDLWFSPRR